MSKHDESASNEQVKITTEKAISILRRRRHNLWATIAGQENHPWWRKTLDEAYAFDLAIEALERSYQQEEADKAETIKKNLGGLNT